LKHLVRSTLFGCALALGALGVAAADPFSDMLGIKGDPAQRANDPRAAAEISPLEARASAGDTEAQLALGMLFYEGIGVTADKDKALQYWRTAADLGNEQAGGTLAMLQDVGLGDPKDYSRVMKWYLTTSGQGNSYSRYYLGMMYENGMGVPRNHVTAWMWIRLSLSGWSVDDNNTPPLPNRARVAEQLNSISSKMTLEERAEAEGLARDWIPSCPKSHPTPITEFGAVVCTASFDSPPGTPMGISDPKLQLLKPPPPIPSPETVGNPSAGSGVR
jgi:hypothetical protein